MKNILYATLGLATLATSSCKVGPDYVKPTVPLPNRIRGGDNESPSLGAASWKRVFGDPVLQGLIGEALANNRDLVAATYRIEQAQAMAGAARSEFFPTIDGSTSATRTRLSEANGTVPPGVSPYANSFDLTALLSYEVDIWGRIRRSNESARARVLQSEFARSTVQSSLVAAVASVYVDLRAFDRQLEISERTLDSRKKSFSLVQERAKQGVSSDLEVSQGEVLLRQAEVAIPTAQQAILLKENQLSLLLGRMPGGITRGRNLDGLGTSVRVSSGLPSAVLEKRPDILAAEQNLVALNADIGVAKAAYFPALRLTGRGGLLSADVDNLFDANARTWSFAPQLAGPIFDAGRTKFGVKGAEARKKEAVANYEKAIQTAFREVADALQSYAKVGDIVSRQTALVAALQKVADLASARYEGGASSYLEVLDAQRALFDGELTLTNAMRLRVQTVVEAYRSLGGGWQE